MKQIKKVFIQCLILVLFSGLTGGVIYAGSSIPGDKDLKVTYAGSAITILTTQFQKFSDQMGKKGSWENSETYQSYIWNEGEAAFLMTGSKNKPQLVRIVLHNNFKTPRGIKKGSTFDDLIKAYSPDYEIVEGGNGNWYVFKWKGDIIFGYDCNYCRNYVEGCS